MNSFDEKFTKQVKETFENYNASHMVDAGWETFRQKQSKKSKSILLIPLWAKAATITLLISLGGYLTFRIVDNTEVPVLTEEIKKVESKKAEQQKHVEDKGVTISEESKSKPNVAYRKVTPTQVAEPKEEAVITEIIPQPTKTAVDSSFSSETEAAYIAQTKTPALEEATIETDSTILENEDSKEDKPVVAETLNIPEEDEKVKRKTLVSAGLSGMMAKVETMVSASPGVAIGLYAERELTSKISIRPGLAIAKQAFNLGNFSENLTYDAPDLNGVEGEVVDMDNSFDIIAMEIPINLVFNVFERKERSLFISLGTSTMVYLSQHYTGTAYNSYTNNVYNNETELWEDNTTYIQTSLDERFGAFSHTDFFGLANISAGYNFPVGKKSSMSIEPFVQIPVSKLTSTNLTMGFGGVSVKYFLNK